MMAEYRDDVNYGMGLAGGRAQADQLLTKQAAEQHEYNKYNAATLNQLSMMDRLMRLEDTMRELSMLLTGRSPF
jgi:hypothetical protein